MQRDRARGSPQIKKTLHGRWRELTELPTQTRHDQTAAAKLSGIDRTHLWRLVQTYGTGR
ncbi:hypothetical protein AKJ09_03066 [Labilithrix luteola]|uniref:Uncharacterized protein n=1 Tax=Labilithrix luteola TaxID=1391654 RepID=A0A0K1PSA2_9BACT|nr:hypothetical protein [Labilithrix luteola]AKU96402.1 hypothetical protein AKJ09_03066 [Labilithrix luteola]